MLTLWLWILDSNYFQEYWEINLGIQPRQCVVFELNSNYYTVHFK